MFTQRHSKILYCEPTDDSQIGTALLDLSQWKRFSTGSKAGQRTASPPPQIGRDHW